MIYTLTDWNIVDHPNGELAPVGSRGTCITGIDPNGRRLVSSTIVRCNGRTVFTAQNVYRLVGDGSPDFLQLAEANKARVLKSAPLRHMSRLIRREPTV